MSMYFDPIWREHIICVYIILIYAYTDTDQKSDWGLNGSMIRLSYIQKSSPKWCFSYRDVRVCFLIGALGFNRVTVVRRCTFFWQFPGANPKTSRRWCAVQGCECVYLTPLQPCKVALAYEVTWLSQLLEYFKIMVSPCAGMYFRMAECTG